MLGSSARHAMLTQGRDRIHLYGYARARARTHTLAHRSKRIYGIIGAGALGRGNGEGRVGSGEGGARAEGRGCTAARAPRLRAASKSVCHHWAIDMLTRSHAAFRRFGADRQRVRQVFAPARRRNQCAELRHLGRTEEREPCASHPRVKVHTPAIACFFFFFFFPPIGKIKNGSTED